MEVVRRVVRLALTSLTSLHHEVFLLSKKVRVSRELNQSSQIFRQHEMQSLPRFEHFLARKMAAGKSAPPSGTLLDFLL